MMFLLSRSFRARPGRGRKRLTRSSRAQAAPGMKVFHEKPIPNVYSAIDNDLARDNLENDIPAADLEDL